MLMLTRERLARGWSKSELARRARIGASDLAKIETGRLRAYPIQLRKLARALGFENEPARLLEQLVHDVHNPSEPTQ